MSQTEKETQTQTEKETEIDIILNEFCQTMLNNLFEKIDKFEISPAEKVNCMINFIAHLSGLVAFNLSRDLNIPPLFLISKIANTVVSVAGKIKELNPDSKTTH